MTTRSAPTDCPRCEVRLLPVVYGLPNWEMCEQADRGEILLGGCLIDFVDLACPNCWWEYKREQHFIDARDHFTSLATESVELTNETIEEAEDVEDQAEGLNALVLLADGLFEAMLRAGVDGLERSAAERFVAVVHSGTDRGVEAADLARRTICRVLDLLERSDGDDPGDDQLYEDILTAGVPRTDRRGARDDAGRDAGPALRHLARLALTVSAGDVERHEELERLARGVLRLGFAGIWGPSLESEKPEIWSVTVDGTHLESAGLLADVLVERRSGVCATHVGAKGVVEISTSDRNLFAESGCLRGARRGMVHRRRARPSESPGLVATGRGRPRPELAPEVGPADRRERGCRGLGVHPRRCTSRREPDRPRPHRR